MSKSLYNIIIRQISGGFSMIFNPRDLIKKNGCFSFGASVTAQAHPCLNKSVIKDFWLGFCARSSTLTISDTDSLVFRIGNAPALEIENSDYTINITPEGVCVSALTEKELIRGYMTLIDRICPVDTDEGLGFEIDCCEIRDSALIKNRMIHFCVFRSTELWELERFLRFCGALKYTHVVVEFWGTLQYDCMKELAWPNTFSKDQIKPIVAMAKDLGLELIPMVNHWGHAASGRVRHGKHVVLDQNPALATYFTEDGWCWDIKKDKVRALLRSIRRELCELFGEGNYFHIGCDEAYNFDFSKENMDLICGFINEVNQELAAEGRRAIVWGDMFLYRYDHYNKDNRYTCNSLSPETEQYMLNVLDKSIVIADWQYEANTIPVETSAVFKNAGFDCLVCPCDKSINQVTTCLDTVKAQSLFGSMHTTWHTLSLGTPQVTVAAIDAYEDIKPSHRSFGTHSAALMRKVYFVDGEYYKAGWAKYEIGVIT